jgi:hypothetical protein
VKRGGGGRGSNVEKENAPTNSKKIRRGNSRVSQQNLNKKARRKETALNK